jgi:glycosyltransferase involved in cell wall biosynthesis
MKITFVMARADMSGGARVIATHARNLMDRGHEVTVLATPPRSPSMRGAISSLLHGRGWPRTPPREASHFDDSGVDLRVIERYRPIVNSDVPDGDVVIATWWETAHWVAALSPSKGTKAFFVQHYETWGGPVEQVDAAWRLPLQKIVYASWMANLAREKFGDATVAYVPAGVDTNLFRAPPRGRQERPTVGILYSGTPFKACQIGFAAIEKARQTLPNLRVISFGQHAPTAALPLPADTRYTENPPQDTIRDLYAQCDLWLCSSRSEGFFLPALEAMACRCPVVSTRVGFPMDAIEDGKNGYLVDVDHQAALADRILRVMRLSDADWKKMSECAYQTASRYSWQDATALLEATLAALVRRGAATV